MSDGVLFKRFNFTSPALKNTPLAGFRYRKMNKRLAARLPGSGGLMSDDGLPLDVAVTRKPSPLTNGSGAPSLPLLIARGTDAVPYELLRKPMKMEGGSPTGPGSPPDT